MKLVKCSIPLVLSAIVAAYPPSSEESQHIDKVGIEFILKEEGCSLCAYSDVIGKSTIGVGATRDSSGKAIRDNLTLTEEDVARLFIRDLKDVEYCLDSSLQGQLMPQSVYNAAGSLVFNIGCRGVTVNKNSSFTRLKQSAEKEDWPRFCSHITDYKYVGRKMNVAIMERRMREKTLCLSGLEESTDVD